jgi:phosphohistidine phosphatase
MMERRLFIIRHGKSSWDDVGLDDIDRPLAKRGIRGAGEIAERFKRKSLLPQLILSSPANRALSTAQIMAETWGLGPENLQIRDALYMAYVDEIEQVVSSVPGEISELAIFGHNPSFTMYANQFLAAPLENLPTAGAVVLTLESEEWGGIKRKHVKGTCVDYPKRK